MIASDVETTHPRFNPSSHLRLFARARFPERDGLNSEHEDCAGSSPVLVLLSCKRAQLQPNPNRSQLANMKHVSVGAT